MQSPIPHVTRPPTGLARNALLILGSMLVVSTQALAAFTINEIRTASLPGEGREAFLEIAGTPGQSLTGLTYLVIGDSANSSTGTGGTIESVTNFTDASIQSDGFYVGARPDFLLGTPDSELNFTFEANDNVTHLLIEGFSGSFGKDLDTNDDGVLDLAPWTSVLDAVSIVNRNPGDTGFDFVYGDALGFTNVGPANAPILRIYRSPDATGPWFIGDAPAGELDTPGAMNTPVPEPVTGWLIALGLCVLLARRCGQA